MDEVKLFSTVKARVKKRLLFRGMALGICGSTLLFIVGVWAPLSFLNVWGLPFFSVGIFLIGWGLIPYKKLIRLETHPHKIILEKDKLTFISSRGGTIEIPYCEIEKITPFTSKTKYGLRIERKASPIIIPYFLGDSRLDEIVHPDESHNLS